MDSLSQAVLGATVAGVVAPAGHRRKALLMGAALGTLPDLDVLIDYGDAVRNFTFHRGFSHSLFVLPVAALAIWLALLRVWPAARENRYRWLAAIGLALVTHPLLDAHTAYGTQLFWPLDVQPVMWATLFIIDPLFTLPLLAGVIAMAVRPTQRGLRVLRAGLVLSTAYLAWSWVAQSVAEEHVRDALMARNIHDAELFLTPTPFNTVLWRAVVRTDAGVFEAFDSLAVNEPEMMFTPLASDVSSLTAAGTVWAVARLRWFANDFVAAEVINDALVISDLRMGQSPHFVFRHVAAVRRDGQWQTAPTELLEFAFENRMLADVWTRAWNAPDGSVRDAILPAAR